MKLLTYLFTLFFVFNAIAVAPYGIKGQTQSGTLYSNVHQFPNNQVTNMGGINALVETGNKNILVNPSFEHATFSTGWTNSAGTFAEDLVVEIDGLKAAKVTLSSQTLDLSQDSTLYAAQFADGVQGLASVRVKTTVAGLRVCSRQNGVVSSNLCVNVQANGKWGLYKVPLTLGGTSNGISINSNGTSVTGDVYVDDAFVGAVDLSATQSFDTTCDTAACETEFTAKVDSAGTVYGENQDWISSNCSYGSGVANCTLVSSLFTVAPSCRAISLVSGNTATTMLNIDTSTSLISFLTRDSNSGAVINRTIHIHCSRQGSDYTAAINARKAFQKSKVSSFSSTNADTDWQSCQFASLAWQGLGTVTNNLRCKRQGGDLLIEGNYTSGSTTGSEAQILLPTWSGSQLVIASSKVGVNQNLGRNTRGVSTINSGKQHSVIGTGGQSYIGLSQLEYTQAVSPLSRSVGSSLMNAGDVNSLNIRIPIEGWENSNIIIGQFNGLESCTNSYECTDVFSADVSAAGVVSNENIDWISGNASLSSSTFTFTWKTGLFTVAPNCVATARANAATAIIQEFNTPSSTTGSWYTYLHTGVATAYPFKLICQKQGVDYIGKTAKAVASDQNISTPGTIKSTLCSAKISSTGVITDQKGGCFSSCTNATTPVCTFTSNYWVSGQVPNCWYVGTNGSGGILSSGSTSSTTFQGPILNGSFVAQAADRIYYCHGERQ